MLPKALEKHQLIAIQLTEAYFYIKDFIFLKIESIGCFQETLRLLQIDI